MPPSHIPLCEQSLGHRLEPQSSPVEPSGQKHAPPEHTPFPEHSAPPRFFGHAGRLQSAPPQPSSHTHSTFFGSEWPWPQPLVGIIRFVQSTPAQPTSHTHFPFSQ